MSNPLADFWPRKWPSKKQWKRLPEILNKKEKAVFLLLLLATFFSFLFTAVSLYYSRTEIVPARGGVYREGFIRSTRWLNINPIYASQSETERDIIEVAFDGLMRYDKKGNLIPNIAKSYSTEDNKVFDIKLRDDVYWSDGEKLTADDILFTVKTIQSPDYQSTLRQQWMGVHPEKIDDYNVRFALESSSSIFPENLTLKPIPQHIFEDYSPRDFRYSIYNMMPIGSGPYRFKESKEDSGGDVEYLKLERNPYYFGNTPFMEEVSFHFFRDLEELLRAQRRGEIDGFALSNTERRGFDFDKVRGIKHHEVSLPRYFSVIFNLRKDGAFADPSVRKALNYATNKEQLIEDVLGGKGYAVNYPLLPEFYLFDGTNGNHVYDLQKAKDILEDAGFENGKRDPEEIFAFTEDLKMESQGEEVRKLQQCLIHLGENSEDPHPEEVTGFYDENTKESVILFQEKYREEILDPHNFKSGTGMVAKSTRKKLNELCGDFFNKPVSLEITITTLDEPMLVQTAEILKTQWDLLGIKTVIDKKSGLDLREEVIRPREFEALLFGTMLSGVFNPLPLWHSTKTDDPGLNLSGYENEAVDDLLETIISEDREEQEDIFLELQEKIMEEMPGIFLYSPSFVYSISEKIKGIDEKVLVNSSKRFEDINTWYINTRRVLRRD